MPYAPRSLQNLTLALLGLAAAGWSPSAAHAEPKAPILAAVGIASDDGSVHTQAGVRMSLAAKNERDEPFLRAARLPLSGRMSELQRCFSAAMLRSAAVEGSVVIDLESGPRGRITGTLVRDDSGDPAMAECMRGALMRTQVRGAPPTMHLEAMLTVNNPVARLRATQQKRSVLADVRMLAGGLAESRGGTQTQEVTFRVEGSAYASPTIGAVSQQFVTHLAGLMDCRRKASRRLRSAEGTYSASLSIDHGQVASVRTKAVDMNDRRAQPCVAAWLSRVDVASLPTADVDISVGFSR